MDLKTALAAHKPALAETYARQVESLAQRVVADLGPGLKGVWNDWRWAKTWTGWLCGYMRKIDGAYVLDNDRVAKSAETYAAGAIVAWAGKIEAKMGEVVGAQVVAMDGVGFRITGSTPSGARVEIEQTMIVNVSRLGNPYNQFPARIRLAGKPVSETAYKRAINKEKTASCVEIP